MKLTGYLTFAGGSTKFNQATMEGASSLAGCLVNNSMAAISNVVFITDQSKLDYLMSDSAAAGNSMYVNWEQLYNGGDPLYDLEFCAGVGVELGKGSLQLITSSANTGVYSIRCECRFDIGEFPLSQDTIKALALVINGNSSQGGMVSYTPSGNEKVLCFVNLGTFVEFSNTVDNEFSWTVNISVVKSE